jgi:glutathione S-transferase
MILYGDTYSQPVRAVYTFMKVEEIPFTFKTVNLMKGENKSKEYLEKVHPGGKVPVLRDGDFVLFESHAIMRYLHAKYCSGKASADHWYPAKDPVQRAKIDMYLDWHHQNTRQGLTNYILYRFLYPLINKKQF